MLHVHHDIDTASIQRSIHRRKCIAASKTLRHMANTLSLFLRFRATGKKASDGKCNCISHSASTRRTEIIAHFLLILYTLFNYKNTVIQNSIEHSRYVQVHAVRVGVNANRI